MKKMRRLITEVASVHEKDEEKIKREKDEMSQLTSSLKVINLSARSSRCLSNFDLTVLICLIINDFFCFSNFRLSSRFSDIFCNVSVILSSSFNVSESKDEFLTSFEAKSKGITASQDLWLSGMQAPQHTTIINLDVCVYFTVYF